MMKHDLEHSGPIQIFEKMFDDVIFQHIRDQTNLYYNQKNNNGCFVSTADLKIFSAFCCLVDKMSYHANVFIGAWTKILVYPLFQTLCHATDSKK